MQTTREVGEPVETLSAAEERFNRARATTGLVLAPLSLLTILFARFPGLTPQSHRLAAILAMVVVLWITEALPMAVTAVLGPVLAVVFLVAPAQTALAPFADPIIFLFIVGVSPARILIVYGSVATALSMWISNTATTAMMFPIGLSIVAHLKSVSTGSAADIQRFALAMMLITSFGASIGGMGTPVGTPPNLIF